MEAGNYKKAEAPGEADEDYWEKQARWPLFRSKRALELAGLLSVRMTLRRSFGDAPSRAGLTKLLGDRAGRDAVAKVVRRAKADRVGTAIADLTVCGAVPPYNEVLGGKLVAMLMVGPETVLEYRSRYGGSASVIASSMAGRPICRAADLVFIGTTSLYGQRPSQYDRIAVPRDPAAPSGPGLRYEYLGRTRGIGTFQFGDQTVSDLARLLAQSQRGQQVNSVFGEGPRTWTTASPRGGRSDRGARRLHHCNVRKAGAVSGQAADRSLDAELLFLLFPLGELALVIGREGLTGPDRFDFEA